MDAKNHHLNGFVHLNFCLGLGDDFEGPFAPEGYELTLVIILPGLGTRLGYVAK